MFVSLVNVEVIRFVVEVEIVNVFGGRSSVVENSVFFVCPVVFFGFVSVELSFLFVTSGGDVMSIGEGGFTDSVVFVDFVAVNDVARDAVVLSSEDGLDLVEPCLVVVFFEELSTVGCPDSIEVGIGVLWVCVGVTSCCVITVEDVMPTVEGDVSNSLVTFDSLGFAVVDGVEGYFQWLYILG